MPASPLITRALTAGIAAGLCASVAFAAAPPAPQGQGSALTALATDATAFKSPVNQAELIAPSGTHYRYDPAMRALLEQLDAATLASATNAAPRSMQQVFVAFHSNAATAETGLSAGQRVSGYVSQIGETSGKPVLHFRLDEFAHDEIRASLADTQLCATTGAASACPAQQRLAGLKPGASVQLVCFGAHLEQQTPVLERCLVDTRR